MSFRSNILRKINSLFKFKSKPFSIIKPNESEYIDMSKSKIIIYIIDIDKNLIDKKKNLLMIFDMDFTVLNENSDYEIRDLLSKDDRELVANSKDYKSWADEVNAYFNRMKLRGVTIDDIKNRIQRIPLTDGFNEIFHTIRQIKLLKGIEEYKNTNLDVMFLSGANVKYVNWVLEKHSITDIVDDYISFSCKDIDGKLVVGDYHSHSCKSCDKSLCKEKAIKDYIDNIVNTKYKDTKNFKYDKICYVGDGGNDYCAGIAISDINVNYKNHLMVRKGFILHRMLYDHEGNPRPKSKVLKCEISLWGDGYELSKQITKNFLI